MTTHPLRLCLHPRHLWSPSCGLCCSPPRSLGQQQDPPKVGIVGRFKQMMKDYWYVLVPVHVATSILWFGGFYLMLKSGVDIVGFLQMLGTSDRILAYMSDSEAGYYALSYACYKLATPIRYTVTVGGTTLAVAKLKDTGYLRPTSQVMEQMKTQKENLREKKDRIEDRVREQQENWREKYEEKKDLVEDKMDNLREKYEEKKDVLEDKFDNIKKFRDRLRRKR